MLKGRECYPCDNFCRLWRDALCKDDSQSDSPKLTSLSHIIEYPNHCKNSISIPLLFNQSVSKDSLLIDETFFKQRTKSYLHFDKKLTPSKLFKYITDPNNISKHSFLPFIAYTNIDKKLYKPNSNIEYKEKKRPISYPSHLDGQIYGYYAHLL